MKSLILLLFIGFCGFSCEMKNTQADDPGPTGGEQDAQGKKPAPTPRNADGSFSGFNFQGEEETCQEMKPGTICTQVFTEEDAFGQDCAKAGYQNIQCDCHKWLCEVPKSEFSCGTTKQLKCKKGYRCEFKKPQDSASEGICVPSSS